MEKINKEQLEELLVKMFGELKLNKPHIKTYLQALEDYNILSKEDVKMFHNYLDSHYTKLEVAQILSPKHKKETVKSNIEKTWEQKKGGKKNE